MTSVICAICLAHSVPRFSKDDFVVLTPLVERRAPEAAASNATSISLMTLLAHNYLRNHRPDRAVALLEAVVVMTVPDGRTLALLSLAQLRAGKAQRALATLDRLAVQGPIDQGFHLLRAQTLASLGRHDEAASAMRAFLHMRATSAAQPQPHPPTN